MVVDVLSMDGHMRWSLEATREAISRLPRVSVTGQFQTSTHIPPITSRPRNNLLIEHEDSKLLVGPEWLPQELGRLIGSITREEFEIDNFADLLVGLFNIDWAAQEGITPAKSVSDPGSVAPVTLAPLEEEEESQLEVERLASPKLEEDVDAYFPPEKSPRESIKVDDLNPVHKRRLDELRQEAQEDELNRGGGLPAQFLPTGQGYKSLSPYFLRKRVPPVWYQYMGYMGVRQYRLSPFSLV